MANLTTVTLTAGVPTAGTGTVSTLDNLIGTAGAGSAQVLTIQGNASGTPVPISGTVSINAIPTGSNIIGSAKITDGTNTATFGTYGTAPGAVSALNVNANVTNALSPGRNTPANSSPVVLASQDYKTVAASTTAQVLGTTGAVGDWLDFLLVIPTTTSPGVVTILDNATSISVFAGGASSLGSLVPFTIPIRAKSISGAWKVTTGAGLSVVASGNFT